MMEDELKSKPDTSRTKSIILGVFLILFGLIIGALTYVTVIGPIVGLIIVAIGVYLLWKASQTNTPI